MQCPYCAEQIHDDALVCRHCHRDFFIEHKLLDTIRTREADLATLRAENARLRASGPRPSNPPSALIAGFLLPLGALLLTHDLAVIIFDWPTWVLRLASVAIPLLVAAFVTSLARLRWVAILLLALALAAAAVFAMAGTDAAHDHVALLPETARDWRETAEYAASIALGFLTGALVAHARGDHAMQVPLHHLFPHAARMARVIEVGMPFVTLVFALYAGLKSLF